MRGGRDHDTSVEKSKEKGSEEGIADSQDVGERMLLFLSNWAKARSNESSVGRFGSE